MDMERIVFKGFEKLVRNVRNDISHAERLAKNVPDFVDEVSVLVDTNPFLIERNILDTLTVVNEIGSVYKVEVGGVPLGGTREVMLEHIRTNAMHYVTRMGDDMRQALRDVMEQNLKDGNGMRQLAKELEKTSTDIGIKRGQLIARTETVRAQNLAEYSIASERGDEAFIVISASDCCPICEEEYDGAVFDADEVEMLPPLHPNCRCTAKFFRKKELAESMADNLSRTSSEDEDLVEEIV